MTEQRRRHAARMLRHLERQAEVHRQRNSSADPPFETTAAERALLVIVNRLRAELAAARAERDAAHAENIELRGINDGLARELNEIHWRQYDGIEDRGGQAAGG
jgi:hypothetical protein